MTMMAAFSLMATLVDFSGTLVLVLVATQCLFQFLRRFGWADLDGLRLRLAGGLVFALSLKTGAGLLRTITAASWQQVEWLLVVVGLRFFLGRVLKAQSSRLTGADTRRVGRD